MFCTSSNPDSAISTMATIVQPTIAPAASVSVADASLPFPDGKRILWAYIPGNTAYFLDNTGTKWVDVK